MIVNIKYVNFPGPGTSGKWGSIVDQNGTKIMVPVDKLGEFRAGTTVSVATKDQVWFRGTPDEAVRQVATGGPEDHTVPVQGQGGPVGYQRPAQSQTGYKPNTGFQPRVVQGGVGPRPDDQARDIFITGIVGRAMGSGKFAASEIPVLAIAAAEAWDRMRSGLLRGDRGAQPIGTGDSIPANQVLDPVPGLEPGDPGPELQ